MTRLKPDKEVKHGRHIDYFWPGTVHSVWKYRESIEVRRERSYFDKTHQKLRSTFWKFKVGKTKFGIQR
jgi:hypothetical protein